MVLTLLEAVSHLVEFPGADVVRKKLIYLLVRKENKLCANKVKKKKQGSWTVTRMTTTSVIYKVVQQIAAEQPQMHIEQKLTFSQQKVLGLEALSSMVHRRSTDAT